ncbi:peptidoglycan DD-metalloendopeptidase family protein [Micromonospora sediminimaris]|nr:peptidoglycan DD-metalloendopeptidase family protein [Micromonospora sediminimaris]
MRPRMPILGGLTTLLLLTPSGSAGGVAVPSERSFSPAVPRADAAPGIADTRPFRWPVDGVPRPVRRFDPPPRPWLAGHRGVDLLAPAAATIRAAGAGTVLFAGMVVNRPVVTVGHADGLRTTYEPVQPAVPVGTVVPTGAPLGTLLPGHAGCPAAACLHWGLRQGDDYLDPLALLGLGRVRLLPVGDPVVARVRPLTAGRADRATRPPVARTPRGRCRPGRTAAASRVRSRS